LLTTQNNDEPDKQHILRARNNLFKLDYINNLNLLFNNYLQFADNIGTIEDETIKNIKIYDIIKRNQLVIEGLSSKDLGKINNIERIPKGIRKVHCTENITSKSLNTESFYNIGELLNTPISVYETQSEISSLLDHCLFEQQLKDCKKDLQHNDLFIFDQTKIDLARENICRLWLNIGNEIITSTKSAILLISSSEATLDYHVHIQKIAALEKERKDTNTKRRFTHYYGSVVHNEQLEQLIEYSKLV